MAEVLHNPETRAERSDAPAWLVGLLAGLAVLTIAGVVGVLLLVFPHAAQDRDHGLKTEMPLPRLQSNPTADLHAYRSRVEHELNSYGWVDRARGVVRVPIEEAIRRVARDGIPDWPTGKTEGAR